MLLGTELAIDKLQGNEREVVAEREVIDIRNGHGREYGSAMFAGEKTGKIMHQDTKGTSEWEGWGTALKPAHEPICMARRPLSEKTVAENVLKYGTGGINIDESIKARRTLTCFFRNTNLSQNGLCY